MAKKSQQGTVCKYIKSRLGYGSKIGRGMYELACDSLALDGKSKPDDVSDKSWVNQNLAYISAQARMFGAKQKKESADRPVIFKKTNTQIAQEIKKARPKSASQVKASSKDFLLTYEWRRLRMEVLKKYGAKCQCCGATPETGAIIHVDHIKPRLLFPQLALDINNLQVLCHECNHGKGNWDMTDWRQATV